MRLRVFIALCLLSQLVLGPAVVYGQDPRMPAPATPTPAIDLTNRGQVDLFEATVQRMIEIAQNPMSNSSLYAMTGALSALFLFETLKNLMPHELVKRYLQKREFQVAYEKLKADYQLYRARYKDYREKIKELRAERVALQAKLKEVDDDDAAVEDTRRLISENESSMQRIKELAPIVVVEDSIARMGELLEVNQFLGTGLENLVAEYAKGLPTEKQEPFLAEAHKARRRWMATNRPDYLGEWLLGAGSDFAKAPIAAEWISTLKSTSDEMAVEAQKVVSAFNATVDQHNDGLSITKHLPHLTPAKSAHGVDGDHFVLTPNDPAAKEMEISRGQVLSRFETACDAHLARLDNAQWRAGWRQGWMNNYAMQIYSMAGLTVAGTGLLAVHRSYENRYKKPFAELKQDATIQVKVAENALVDIAGQFEFDQKNGKQLSPFLGMISDHLAQDAPQIAAALHSHLDFTDRQTKEVTDSLHAVANNPEFKALVEKSVYDATLKVYQDLRATSLDRDVLAKIYATDEAVRKADLEPALTAIFSDAIRRIYATVKVKKLPIESLEKDTVQPLVAATMEKLKNYVATLSKSKATATAPGTQNGGPSAALPTKTQPQAYNPPDISPKVNDVFELPGDPLKALSKI
ncbi:hypothetical protein K2X33_03095 [bacterium]|nr:hypothetical protein [bacterium]